MLLSLKGEAEKTLQTGFAPVLPTPPLSLIKGRGIIDREAANIMSDFITGLAAG
jgi:hypothetical protein